ncbi:MAG: hypothetical protein IJ083_05245 [Clostridia bacterium]|nr:hypothetical protein [Clostridia bacterium]
MTDVSDMLSRLPDTAGRGLAGLQADADLKRRIRVKASEGRTTRVSWRYAAVAAAAVLVMTLLIPSLNAFSPPGSLPSITSQPAGDLSSGLDEGHLGGMISVGKGSNLSAAGSLWADGDGATFPLIGIKGRFYRLLTSPDSVDTSLLGQSLGKTNEYSLEPSLSQNNVLVSNLVTTGHDVYGIRGMDGTLVAAEVDGTMRLFQRVSFNGTAIQGRERLEDTLQLRGHVSGISLDDAGQVTDPDTIGRLLGLLFDHATYENGGTLTSARKLLFALDNGLTVQMLVKNDRLAGCGVWSCPEFLEEMEAVAK